MFQTDLHRSLCEVIILHGYHLDNGLTGYDAMTTAAKSKALKGYHVSNTFDIVPTIATAKQLRNHRILPVVSNDGLHLMITTKKTDSIPLTGLADSEIFVFLLKAKIPSEFTYSTQLTENRSRVLFFSNYQPAEVVTVLTPIPLQADAKHADDSFLLSEADTITVLDLYVPVAERKGVTGIICIKTKGVGASRDLLTAGSVKATSPKFKIHFDAKKTFWKYKKESVSFIVETKVALPLTKNGFINIDPANDFTVATNPTQQAYQYPNPSLGTIEITPTKTYSVIFI
ncbi:MAG: hypothetical protein A3D31_07885 [Candidatus Fluviicola riflensis]|nr:MAG: hypothetical protein CHH17_07125 [Candidatus Fluviicola riflensis]OGS79863.1 MAG: hypothetical protein A3D31_07885 [Candidatus Fluviicola riflensis]OGS82378.1 MAG: hypothetical protein A2724_16830 [Fluviicola sp. RIFCSPHIGHO2_01_FULL_43_53]